MYVNIMRKILGLMTIQVVGEFVFCVDFSWYLNVLCVFFFSFSFFFSDVVVYSEYGYWKWTLNSWSQNKISINNDLLGVKCNLSVTPLRELHGILSTANKKTDLSRNDGFSYFWKRTHYWQQSYCFAHFKINMNIMSECERDLKWQNKLNAFEMKCG